MVHVVNIKARQFTDPDAGGVEQLSHGPVPQRDRASLLGRRFQGGKELPDLRFPEHLRERLVPLRSPEPQGRIHGQQFLRSAQAVKVRTQATRRARVDREGPGRAARRASRAAFPGNPGQVGDPVRGRVLQQFAGVRGIGPHGVLGPGPLVAEVPGETGQGRLEPGRQRAACRLAALLVTVHSSTVQPRAPHSKQAHPGPPK